MKQIILDFPKQLKAGLDAAKDIKIDGGFDNIIACGMGGSAMPAGLLPIAYRLSLPMYVHRNYGLPPQANENSLIVCVSYSGDTEETISAYEEAIKNGYKVVGIATGGKLGELCDKNGTPWAKIPSEPKIPPRSAVGYQFAALVEILNNVKSSQELQGTIMDHRRDAVTDIANLAQTLNSENFEKQGEEIAKKLIGKIPIIYSSEKWGALAYSWKTNLNENSKIHAFYNIFPEFNHNELNGYASLGKFGQQAEVSLGKLKVSARQPQCPDFYVIILRDSEDHPRVMRRMEAAADIIKSKDIEVDFIDIQGENVLEKIFNTYILGLWLSYFLAIERKIDPVLVEIIEEFKKQI